MVLTRRPRGAGAALSGTFVRFPPGRGHIHVPLEPSGAAALGTTLYAASRRRPFLAQQALWALARVGGGRLLPGVRGTWQSPVEPEIWAELWESWSALLGGIEGVSVYERPQTSRSGLVLALWRPGRSMVVRLSSNPLRIEREQRLAAAATDVATRTFRVPATLGRGRTGAWHWLASSTMGDRPHRPVLALHPEMLDELGALLTAVLVREPDTPEHWQPAHGDLTPWNLRRSAGTTWLIDWEDAGWAPPHADSVYFRASVAAMYPHRAQRDGRPASHAEAVRYWKARVLERPLTDPDPCLRARLVQALGD